MQVSEYKQYVGLQQDLRNLGNAYFMVWLSACQTFFGRRPSNCYFEDVEVGEYDDANLYILYTDTSLGDAHNEKIVVPVILLLQNDEDKWRTKLLEQFQVEKETAARIAAERKHKRWCREAAARIAAEEAAARIAAARIAADEANQIRVAKEILRKAGFSVKYEGVSS